MKQRKQILFLTMLLCCLLTVTVFSSVFAGVIFSDNFNYNSIDSDSVSVLVNGKACPFFASSPSAQVHSDTYAASKPVEIIIEEGIKTIDIETSGKIANCGGCYRTSITTPDGDYEKYGISLITAPINSLIGVFLDDNNPSYLLTPAIFGPNSPR